MYKSSIYGTDDRIVLDIGSRYCKIGYSGEHFPRHIYSYPTAPLFSLNLKSTEEIKLSLSLLFHLMFTRILLADPKQRKVIIAENVFLPISIKQIISDLLLLKFQVPAINFISASVLALLTTGNDTGLVVDCGNLETTVLPISDLHPLNNLAKSIPIAGSAINDELKAVLRTHCKIVQENGEQIDVTEEFIDNFVDEQVLEDIKSQCCFIGPSISSDDEKINDDKNTICGVTFNIQQQRIYIPGFVRSNVCQVLFEKNDDGNSIASIIFECVKKCPIDLREILLKNILLTGGSCLIPGFKKRITSELRNFFTVEEQESKNPFNILSNVFKPNIISWVGGSLFGSVKANANDEMQLADYVKGVPVVDWSRKEL